MKKRFLPLVAFLLSILMGLSMFTGCDLITVDSDRDMEQVVATVCIGEGAPKDEIKKKEMVMAYMNYGYYYVSSYGYTQEETFNMIINNLINSRILVQNAMKSFEAGVVKIDDTNSITITDGVQDTLKEKWDLERYLSNTNKTDDLGALVKISEIAEAQYETIKSVNELIDNYEEVETKQYYGDTLVDTVRTVPTDAANAEDEVTEQEKLDYISAGVDKGESGSERRKAYNKAMKVLEDSGLIKESIDGDITQTEYYEDLLVQNQESVLMQRYEKIIKDYTRKTVTYQDLQAKYVEMYNAQKDSFDDPIDVTAFSEALSGASAKSPIVYSPLTGYGYVYNLLLGASTIQSAQLTALKETSISDADYYQARRTIFNGIKAVDLRSTWLLSGYDFDYESKKFTGDYALATDSIPFQADITYLNPLEDGAEKPDDYVAQYKINKLKEFGLDEFISFMDNYLYGANASSLNKQTGTGYIYQRAEYNGTPVEEYDQKINELLFAFSTDSGSLNTYKGYVIEPKPDREDSETYVTEFAAAARELITVGGNSYVIVATDYGYHIMFFSEVLNARNYDSLEKYLDTLNIDKGSLTWEEYYNQMINDWDDFEDTDFYLYMLQDNYSSSIVSSVLSNIENGIVNSYKDNEEHVVKYSDRYADLLV